jgi:hypothetical protein
MRYQGTSQLPVATSLPNPARHTRTIELPHTAGFSTGPAPSKVPKLRNTPEKQAAGSAPQQPPLAVRLWLDRAPPFPDLDGLGHESRTLLLNAYLRDFRAYTRRGLTRATGTA